MSLLSWAIAGLWSDFIENGQIFAVRIGLAVLQACVGALILIRKPAVEQGAPMALIASLPSFLLTGILFRLASPINLWPKISEIVFLVSIGGVLIAFWSLRKSFAILPARRATVNTGLYKIIRHPAYFFELLMAAACAWAAQSFMAAICFFLLVPMLVLRIQQEEKLMKKYPFYLQFQKQSRWRLLPWVW